MNSLRFFDRRARLVVVGIALLLAIIVPAIASAAQLNERSIQLSSSSVDATGVSYEVKFKSVGTADAFVVDFCSDSPVVGQSCAIPTGFSVTGASSTTTDFTGVSALDGNTVRVTGEIGANESITVKLDGITNPDTAGPLYARILTYASEAQANAYTSTVLGSGKVDDGGAAIYINNTIGVSGAVLEALTFCVSGDVIGADCADVESPVLKLGEQSGDVVALSADTVSEGNIYTQISTNALTGAVVSLRSSAVDCGGLVRAGAPASCDILPALDDGVTAGEAKFGVKTATATDSTGPGVEPVGILRPYLGSIYNNSTFAFNYITGNATGVTSTFGDPFLDTAGAPANNKNMQLTFGVSINNSTPAGLYSVDLGLVATGKF